MFDWLSVDTDKPARLRFSDSVFVKVNQNNYNTETTMLSKWICLGLETKLMYHFELLLYVAKQKIVLRLKIKLNSCFLILLEFS